MVRRLLSFVHKFDKRLWILSFGWLVSSLGFAVSIPFVAIYFHSHLSLSLSEIGFFFGALAVVRSLFQALGGEASDRMERRKLMILAQSCRALSFLSIAIFVHYDWGLWPIAGGLVTASIFGAIFQPAANAMVSDILPVERRLEGYAITRSAANLGWAIGPALGGFLAAISYALIFLISGFLTFASVLVLWLMLKSPQTEYNTDRFRFRDVLAIKDDPNLAIHCTLVFVLFLVVAQLMAPFSVYVVSFGNITEADLGYLYGINGLFVAVLQIPITRLFSGTRLTTQLFLGAIIYALGYGLLGMYSGLWFFALIMMTVTFGEMLALAPSLTLTSRLAPSGRMGRYMGIYGFFVASGWSFGPLYGGLILDYLGESPAIAWLLISSLAVVSGVGYLMFLKRLSDNIDGVRSV